MDEIIRVEISANNSIRITKIAPHIRNTFSRDHKLIQLFLPGREPRNGDHAMRKHDVAHQQP